MSIVARYDWHEGNWQDVWACTAMLIEDAEGLRVDVHMEDFRPTVLAQWIVRMETTHGDALYDLALNGQSRRAGQRPEVWSLMARIRVTEPVDIGAELATFLGGRGTG